MPMYSGTVFQDTVQHYGMHTQRDIQHHINFCFSLIIWVLCSWKAKTQNCHSLPSLRNHRELTALPMWLGAVSEQHCCFRQEHQTFPSRPDKQRLTEDKRWNLSCVVWSDVNNNKKKKMEERDFIHFLCLCSEGGKESLYLTPPLRCHSQLNLLKC